MRPDDDGGLYAALMVTALRLVQRVGPDLLVDVGPGPNGNGRTWRAGLARWGDPIERVHPDIVASGGSPDAALAGLIIRLVRRAEGPSRRLHAVQAVRPPSHHVVPDIEDT